MRNKVSEDAMSRLGGFVAARLGLHFPPERWADLARRAALASAEFKFSDPEAFIKWLPDAALAPEQMEILAGHLTINETYFWRETEVFEALTASILPEFARRREKGEKRLRIWSAGCSTGEEPYSLAIALHRAIPFLKDWNITILATDISARVLRKAACGVYGEWSFRNAPGWLRENYFTRRAGCKYAIDPAIKKMVTFAYLNLAQDVFPSPVNNTSAMDLIFCRNVLMYFVPGLMRRVAGGLYNSLIEGGYAVVSSSELSQAIFPQFSPVNFPGAIVYRKDDRGGAPVPELKPAPYSLRDPSASPLAGSIEETGLAAAKPVTFTLPPPPKAEKVKDRTEALIFPVPHPEAEPGGGPAQPPEVPAPASVRALADRGKLTEALALCEITVVEEKLNPVLHYLRALILLELNRHGEAASSLRKALFLAPDMLLANFTLGKVLLRQGDSRAALKKFRNALSLLGAHKSGDVLPETDGLTAGRFREIINATIRTEVPA